MPNQDPEDGEVVRRGPGPTFRWGILNFLRWVGITFAVLVAGVSLLSYSSHIGNDTHSNWYVDLIAIFLILASTAAAVIVNYLLVESKQAHCDKPGRCSQCGYRLAQHCLGRCYICGAFQDGYCRRCLYDLRGTESGRCPECGTQNAVSK